MIKVFLVEDEAVFRRQIRDNVDWKGNGFEFVGESGDGEYAYSLIMKAEPDIVIAKLKLPFMDGFELSRMVRYTHPQTKFVMLCSYNEYNYAKKAAETGFSEYILKPFTSDNLIATLRKVADTIKEKR